MTQQQLTSSSAVDITMDSVIGKMAYAVDYALSTGDVAQLRRISPSAPYTPALWKVLLMYVPEAWIAGLDRDAKEQQWAVLLMALATARGSHNTRVSLGQALAHAGWSELRFVRLMQARNEALFMEVRRVASFLASKAQAADWGDVAKILLNQEGDWAERHRRRVARDYYRSIYIQDQSRSTG